MKREKTESRQKKRVSKMAASAFLFTMKVSVAKA